ncbi:hypothetical protein D1159_09235 [Pseudoflavonifractor sp. 524-17]|uniref:hypothetical protein n=1 Tax=Pseudoflavonifractor sp. 524-17 TaxID=2304577 RepID=UPI00137AC538|nr:hypothetical protein [Pseudoflavonifractor sp. 524-17]NCE64767.1 hypothetical protein [Pseudoflavonifractor sp. 524-17]
MAGIFDEGNMRQVLGRCLPEGETLCAGIHGITLQVNKKKTSYFDVYISVTEHYLIVAECEERKYLNEFYRVPDLRKTVAQDIGTCFPLEEIQSCVIKNAFMGAVNCSITLKDGSFLKLQLPKRGGLGGGMPHHTEYREKIIARLSGLNCAH